MNKLHAIKNPIAHSVAALALAASAAHAADTDIYLNQSSTVFPNVMFVMDTSGSMQEWYSSWVNQWIQAPPDYTATTVRNGPFEADQFYISIDGRIPDSPAGLSTAPLSDLEGCNFTNTEINSQEPIKDDGFTSIRAAIAFPATTDLAVPKLRWLPASKVIFQLDTAEQIFIECSDDSGNHGRTNADPNTYANVNPGNTAASLYTSTPNREIDWQKFPYVTVFSGNYLNYKSNPPALVDYAREVIQNRVIRDSIKRTPDVMASLARFNRATGGSIIRAAKDNSVRENQLELLSVLENTPYAGPTPLSSTLLEVMHYFHGLQVNRSADYTHGVRRNDADWAIPQTDPAAHDNGTYISPITHACQKNYVLLVTDGEPSSDGGSRNDFIATNPLYPDYQDILGRTDCNLNCLEEIGQYMSEQDAAPDMADLYDLDGDQQPDPQTVKVYPIGMEIEQALLNNTASFAGTTSYYAANAAEFEEAFVDILATIKASGGLSLVTASASADRFSKTSNRNFLYYGQFVPSSNFQWRGNLKKYRFAYDENGVAYVTDSDETNNPEITADDGSLIATAKSYWSDNADGNDTLAGGVAEALKGSTRTIRGINSADNTDVAVMTEDNKLSEHNTFYAAAVNASDRSAAEQTNIRKYAEGLDVFDEDGDGVASEQRGAMGALVRSNPVAVQYGGTAAAPEIVVFATTTDGVLHAFDDDSGKELWSIVMPEAYPHLAAQYDNHFSTTPWWGLDGGTVVRVEDKNENGIIESGDSVMLYISGGRGMRGWLMYDVTNATNDTNQVKLVRRGKFDASSNNWDELGMPISKMVPLKYRLNTDAEGVKRTGMLLANGWDPAAEFSYAESTMGRGLSLYDAEDGDPLWKMNAQHGGTGMQYAFATEPTVVDLDGDGVSDLIYAIDVNAQVWRFNVKNGANATSSLIDGARLIKLGADSDTNRRRAYKRIDAAVVKTSSGNQVILAVGTGDLMNPLSDSDHDRLYVIRDKTAGTGTSPASIMSDSDLVDVTENQIGEGSDEQKATALTELQGASGWYIKLPQGEQKAISAPLISAGIVNFPAYQVGGAASNPCEDSGMGSGLLYRLNVLDGTPVSDYDGSGSESLTKTDRFVRIRGAGIPGDVGHHTSPDGVKTILVNRDPFINRPSLTDPNQHATPDDSLQSDSAGYWFETGGMVK